MTLETLIADVRAHAAALHNEWDRKAVDWPLTSESVVVEVGGYTGRWALQIADRYHPRLYVFEPQVWAWEVCQEVLAGKAFVVNAGLGTRNGEFPMAKWGTDGCTFIGGDGEPGSMMRIETVLWSFQIDHIDLMMMNIEGYEYTLIPHMLNCGILPDRLMVQFHPQPDDERTMAIYDRLEALGYRVVWTYGVVLTAWERDSKNSKAS